MNREPLFIESYYFHSFKQARLQFWNVVIGQVIPLVSFFAFAGFRLMPALQEIFASFNKIAVQHGSARWYL